MKPKHLAYRVHTCGLGFRQPLQHVRVPRGTVVEYGEGRSSILTTSKSWLYLYNTLRSYSLCTSQTVQNKITTLTEKQNRIDIKTTYERTTPQRSYFTPPTAIMTAPPEKNIGNLNGQWVLVQLP